MPRAIAPAAARATGWAAVTLSLAVVASAAAPAVGVGILGARGGGGGWRRQRWPAPPGRRQSFSVSLAPPRARPASSSVCRSCPTFAWAQPRCTATLQRDACQSRGQRLGFQPVREGATWQGFERTGVAPCLCFSRPWPAAALEGVHPSRRMRKCIGPQFAWLGQSSGAPSLPTQVRWRRWVSGGAGVALESASWMNLGISRAPRRGRDSTRPVVFRGP